MSGMALTASRVVGWWAAAYTLGLAASVRDARRRELASDLWEHREDGAAGSASSLRIAIETLSRWVRGIPADILWRVNVEGPKVDIKIPFERIVGGTLIALVVLFIITGSISGYDTARDGFGGELRRLDENSALANNVNAFFRAATGFALIAAGAGLYAALRDRSRGMATLIGFGLCAAAVLELVGSTLQLTLVELADEYVTSTGAHQEQVLVTARAIAIAGQYTVTASFFAIMLSTYVLAIVAGRESLVPRWLIGIPVISAALVVGALIMAASGAGDTGLWLVMMSGLLTSVLWLLIAGFWLLFAQQPPAPEASVRAPAPA